MTSSTYIRWQHNSGVNSTKIIYVLISTVFLFTVAFGTYSSKIIAIESKLAKLTLSELSVTQPRFVGDFYLVSNQNNDAVTAIIATVSLHPEAEPVAIDTNPFSVNLRDHNLRFDNVPNTHQFIDKHDGDRMLEIGEQLQVEIVLNDLPKQSFTLNSEFVLDIKPHSGPMLTFHHTP